MSFFVTLQSNLQHVMLYENPELQQKVRSIIPHQQLFSTAQDKLTEAKEADPGEVLIFIQKNSILFVFSFIWSYCIHSIHSTDWRAFLFVDCHLAIEDFLVLELLRWFKQDFFSWVDCLPCGRCGGPTKNSSSLSPTTDDVRWGAQRVENHYCQSCGFSTRFPRSVCITF